MAVKQIPNLPAGIALNGSEELEAVQAGASVRVTAQQIANLASASPGSGDVVGPDTGSTDKAIVRFDGTTGTSIQNSTVLLSDAGGITGATYNGLNITTTTGTFSLASGKTLAVDNTLTFVGSNGSAVNFAAGGTVAYTGGTLAQFASTTSAQLAGVISDETGTGSLVFSDSPVFNDDITLGVSSSTQGQLILANTGAYKVKLQSSNSTSADYTLTFPAAGPTNGYYLQSDGSGNLSWAAGGGGGGGSPGGTANNIQFNSNPSGSFTGSSDFIYDDTAKAVTIGQVSTSTGLLKLANSTSAHLVTVQSGANTAAWTIKLPIADGSTGQVLKTDGSGQLGWVSPNTGTVTSVSLDPSTTGLTVNGGTSSVAITTSGTFTLGGTLAVGNGGTGLQSGTSGGVLYYSATNTLASSAVLANDALVIGKGAGNAPTTTSTATGILTFLGSPTSANLANAVTDETGTGSLVFGTSPALTTPSLSGETFSTAAAVTAGTNTQGQGALTDDFNIITTASANPSGVTLPTATTGRRIVIVNRGANPVNVYPATGAAIDGLSANASISIPVNKILNFIASSATQWYSGALSNIAGPLPVANGGTGATSAGIGAFNNITGYNASGVTGDNSSYNLVFSNGPSFTAPSLGAATASSINKVAITAPATSATLTIADGKTLTASNSITLATTSGTDGLTMTFPSASATIARTDASQSFTGTQTFAASGIALTGSSTGTTTFASANAGASSYTITFPAATGNVLTTAATATITKGFTVTPYSIGTFAASFTPDPANGNYQYGTRPTNATNVVVDVPGSDCAIDILVTNNGTSNGTFTFSASYKAANTGNTIPTTTTGQFVISIRRINGVSSYVINTITA